MGDRICGAGRQRSHAQNRISYGSHSSPPLGCVGMDEKVTLISAGMLAPKKHDNLFARSHLYLNFGLLSLATELRQAGFDAQLYHGRFEEPSSFVSDLCRLG